MSEKTTSETKNTNRVTLVYETWKKPLVETFFDSHLHSDWAQVVEKFIDDFNNSAHLLMKASKEVVEILID